VRRECGLFEIGPARHNLIGDFRVGDEMGRAVENPEMGIIELPRQLLGRDQNLGMGKALAGGHADVPLSIRCIDPSYPAARATGAG